MGIENLLQNFSQGQDPYGAPFPGLTELALRAAPGLLPPRGQLPNTFLGGATRFGGTLAGVLGEEMATKRRDPLRRLIPAAGEAISGLSQVQVPVAPTFPNREALLTKLGAGRPEFEAELRARAPETETPLEPSFRPAADFAEAMQHAPEELRKKALLAQAGGLNLAPMFPKPETFSVGRGQTVYERRPGGEAKEVMRGPPEEPHVKTFRRNVSPAEDAEFTVVIDRDGNPIGEAKEIPGTRARLTDKYQETWLPTGKSNEEALFRVNERTGERAVVPGVPARPRRERTEMDDLTAFVKKQQADIARMNSIQRQIKQAEESLYMPVPGQTAEQNATRQAQTQKRLALLNEAQDSGGLLTDEAYRKAVDLYGKDEKRLTRALKALGFTTLKDGNPIP